MIVLDTHAWIWFIDAPDLLSSKAHKAILAAQEEDELYISNISVWEVYMLAVKGRLQFSIPTDVWVKRCEQLSYLHFIAVNNEITRISVNTLSKMHNDPADRMIAATSIYLGATLITKDRKIRQNRILKTLW